MKFNFNRSNFINTALGIIIAMSFGMLLLNISNIYDYFNVIIGILMPFIYGFCLAYLLNPIVKFQENYLFPKIIKKEFKYQRGVSIFFSLVFAIALVCTFFAIVIPQISMSVMSIFNDIIPSFIVRFTEISNELHEVYGNNATFVQTLDQITIFFHDFITNAANVLPKMINDTILTTISITTVILSGAIKLIVGIIVAIYLLLSKEKFIAQLKKFLYAFLPQEFVNSLIDISHNSNRIFSGFISGKILDSFIIGIICFAGMSVLKLEYAVLISFIVGVTNIIPYFGPFIGAIPSAMLLILISPKQALIFAIFILVLQQVDGNIIGPKILGDSTGLSAIWVIFSVTLFGGIWGFIGMFIGVPVFAVIYSLIKSLAEYNLKKKGLSCETSSFSSKNKKD